MLKKKVAELGTKIKQLYTEMRAETAKGKAETLQQLKKTEAKKQKLIEQWNDLQCKLLGGKQRLAFPISLPIWHLR